MNILLVTARPFDADVRYRSISRPLVDQIDALRLPASVTVLRPPTFDALRDHLRKWPHHYHILHFDGHGAYGAALGHPNPHALQGLQGQLVFEDEQGKPDPQSAEVLSELLRDCSVPVVVLNACQSAMVDERAEDAFASVAAGLLRSCVRSVVAMAYSLYVSGAQQFLPAFYRRLFETGSRHGDYQTDRSPDLQEALAETTVGGETTATVGEGDLACEALLLLADDPDNRQGLTALIEGPPVQRFLDPTTIAVGVAALIAL